MLNNETWLAHPYLFHHWTIELKPWARTLGWFTELEKTCRETNGWTLIGEHDLRPLDYVQLVDEVESTTKLYGYINYEWKYFDSPILFVMKKAGTSDVYIAGWAGEKKLLDKLKKKDPNPWNWKGITLIEVDPQIGVNLKYTLAASSKAHPVFFLSNGETNAEKNWDHLKKMVPRAQRIDGIDGRRNAFFKCVDESNGASRFFVVTGKNFVTDRRIFDQELADTNSHIIFQAKNMSNRLEYGHMGVVCYNTNLVLSTPVDFGLDFTQYSSVEQAPLTVSEASFATSPFEAWRTAFRECVKLGVSSSPETALWLKRWVAFAEGPNSEWVLLGAQQGWEYAQTHREDTASLRNTVDWNWLREYFDAHAQLVAW